MLQDAKSDRKRSKPKVWRMILYFILVVLGTMFIIPFLWIVLTSFKPESQIVALPPQWIPNPFTLDNYTRALIRVVIRMEAFSKSPLTSMPWTWSQ